MRVKTTLDNTVLGMIKNTSKHLRSYCRSPEDAEKAQGSFEIAALCHVFYLEYYRFYYGENPWKQLSA